MVGVGQICNLVKVHTRRLPPNSNPTHHLTHAIRPCRFPAVITHKLIGCRKGYTSKLNDEANYRQMVVTASPKLADKLREEYTKSAATGDRAAGENGQDGKEVLGAVADPNGAPAELDHPDVPAPGLLPAEEVPLPRLAQAGVPEHEGHHPAEVQPQAAQPQAALPEVAEPAGPAARHDVLPESYAELPAVHYPVFTSMEDLMKMMDRTVGRSFYATHPSCKKVDFDKFRSNYYPTMQEPLQKELSSERVYSEIMSCIKGSRSAMETAGTHRLSKEAYCALSTARDSCLDEGLRGGIYTFCDKYEREKKKKGEWDYCDAVIDVYRRLLKFPGLAELPKMHQIYVDEVQDLCEVEVTILHLLCADPATGFVYAGQSPRSEVPSLPDTRTAPF